MSKQGSSFEPEEGSLKKRKRKSKRSFIIEYRVTRAWRKAHPSWRMWSKWSKWNSYKTETSRDEALKAKAKNDFGMYEFRKGKDE